MSTCEFWKDIIQSTTVNEKEKGLCICIQLYLHRERGRSRHRMHKLLTFMGT